MSCPSACVGIYPHGNIYHDITFTLVYILCVSFHGNIGAFVSSKKGAAGGSSAKRNKRSREHDEEVDEESPRLTGLAVIMTFTYFF